MRTFPGVKNLNCSSVRDAEAAVVTWLPLKHLPTQAHRPSGRDQAGEAQPVVPRFYQYSAYLRSAVNNCKLIVDCAAF